MKKWDSNCYEKKIAKRKNKHTIHYNTQLLFKRINTLYITIHNSSFIITCNLLPYQGSDLPPPRFTFKNEVLHR